MSIAQISEPVSAEEARVRVDLAACYRLVAHYGWDDLIFTHISARVPGPDEHFLINPFGLMFHEITASSLVKVDLEGNLVSESEWQINPAGFVIHSAVHAARPDVGCVMHLHTDDGVAVSIHKDGLLPLSQHALITGVGLAYHDYEGIALDLDEQARLVADLGSENLMILRNHGTLACGADVATAFLNMYNLERSCSIQVRALSTTSEPNRPADDVVKLVDAQIKGSVTGATRLAHLAWPALMRMMDAKDPGFRD